MKYKALIFIILVASPLIILLIAQCSDDVKKTNLDKIDFDRFSDFIPESMEISNNYLNTIKTKDSTYYFEILVLSPKDTCKSRQLMILEETNKGLIFRTKCDSAILRPKLGIDPFINIFIDSIGFSILHAGGDDKWEMRTTFQYKLEQKDWYLKHIKSQKEVAYNSCDTSAMFGPLLNMEDLSEKDFGIIYFKDYSIYRFGANR